MNVFEMIVLIVLVSTLGSAIMYWIKSKHDKGIDFDELSSELGLSDSYCSKQQMKACLARIDQLEERIRVLERIATDKGTNLAHEIDNLA
ncbi:hypothetical protein [Emcibacter nanhaiensis]|uniref:Uncharacterized protein n=1 Tax=Emcibacter nanhaiensis TaxID=1505037 RepID=A0A501PH49_9PROT|nr:hypothetical protein [Emcibacter nanhaiensis]TPD59186.1 hypothetical protein FIV46_13235 [Emcibacter nanhaiensis]